MTFKNEKESLWYAVIRSKYGWLAVEGEDVVQWRLVLIRWVYILFSFLSLGLGFYGCFGLCQFKIIF